MKALVLLGCMLPAVSAADTDYQCLSDCTARYSRAYCLQVCEIRQASPAPRAPSPFESFLKGQQARQEADIREAEIARARAEAAAAEKRSEKSLDEDRIWSEVAKEAKEWVAEQEKAKLRAENDALRKRIEEMESKAAEQESTEPGPVPPKN